MVAARVAALISDSVVLVLTGIKTRQARKQPEEESDIERSLKGVLLQDSKRHTSSF